MSPRRIKDKFSLVFSKFSQIALVATRLGQFCENFENTRENLSLILLGLMRLHILIDHSPWGAFQGQWKDNLNEHNSFKNPNWQGGRPVGYLQAWLRSWTWGYREQLQLVLRAGLESGTSGFQVRHPNHSALSDTRNEKTLALFFFIRTFFIRTLRLKLTQILRTY